MKSIFIHPKDAQEVTKEKEKKPKPKIKFNSPENIQLWRTAYIEAIKASIEQRKRHENNRNVDKAKK